MISTQIPSSKSISNRALILASLGNSEMILKNLLISDDINFLIGALKNFGVRFEFLNKNDLKVSPTPKLKGYKSQNFIGNGGTPARFLTALSVLVEGEFELFGVDRMHERPFAEIFEAIQTLGVEIEFQQNKNFLPAVFKNKNVLIQKNLNPNSGETMGFLQEMPVINISGKISSQFISALLLVGPKLHNGIHLNIENEVPSRPYIEMTMEILRIWGAQVEGDKDFKTIKVFPGLDSPKTFSIPSDCSSASYPLAFALLKQEPLKIINFGTKTFQGDEKFVEILEKMGVKINRIKEDLEIFPPQNLQPLGDINFEQMPDVSMTAMLLASFAEGVSTFSGLESLRVKECDRIEAMRQGLNLLGIDIQIEDDQVRIEGDPKNREKIQKLDLENQILKSHEDHRIAMIWGILKSAFTLEVKISDPESVAKSWPDFWVSLAQWNKNLRPVASAIIEDKKNKKFLIVEKPRKNNAWQFPQGGIDPGETLLKAAKRETQEECGANLCLKFKGEKPLGNFSYLFPENFQRHEKNVFGASVSFFYAEFISGEVFVDGHEIINYKWVSETELQKYFSQEYWENVKFILLQK